MRSYAYFLLSIVIFSQNVFSQDFFKTSIKTELVISSLSQGQAQWSVPVSENEKLPLRWEERKTSFTDKERIQTFLGFQGKSLVATISVFENSISGSVYWNNDEIHLRTSDDGFLTIYNQKIEKKCGTCTHNHCKSDTSVIKRPSSISAKNGSAPKIKNTDVLRVYRLAVAISYEYFSDMNAVIGFRNNINEVKAFWAKIEAQLNEVYERDLGIRFEVLKDERLISTQEDEVSDKPAYYIVNNGTRIINEKIGSQNYDLGIHIAKTEFGGLAMLEYAYREEKASAVSLVARATILHEIGHLFGAVHTFSNSRNSRVDLSSEKTEILTGQSVMSYGYPRDFFSLRSVQLIREKLAEVPYFSDRNRTNMVGSNPNVKNIPYGIPIQNQAPTIDVSKIKESYKIPKGTFFQFHIPAQDTQTASLLYMAQQTDIRKGEERSNAVFLTRKATTNNPVLFQTEYSEEDANYVFHTKPDTIGTFTFWLAVNDAQPAKNQDYIPKYDVAQTIVNIVEGTPFTITSPMKKQYKGGNEIQLTWNVDGNVFDKSTSKVRILLSDDFGKTFKHILVSSTENDGVHKVVLPNININTIEFSQKKLKVSAGVIKIEEIDGIAYALTNIDPQKGGFKITRDPSVSTPFSFTKTPEANISVSCNSIPEADSSQFEVTGCESVDIKHKDIKKGQGCAYTIERIYTAQGCGKSIEFKQTINVSDNISPSFTGNLPQNISVEENNIPGQVDLQATDNCSPNVKIVKTQEEKQENGVKVLIYKWLATDDCGNKTEHRQEIKVLSSEISFVGDLPQNVSVSCEKDIPSVVTLSVSGNCNAKVVYNGETKSDETCSNAYTLHRSWTASNDCGNRLTHTQIITINDNISPSFTGNLPQNISVEENNIPGQADLQATDNCSPNVKIVKTQEEKQENGVKVLIYKWLATDDCGNETEHRQQIIIENKTNEQTTQEEIIVFNAVSTDLNSNNYLKIADIEKYAPVQLMIFNLFGQKVFHSDNYQKNGEVFKGFANRKSSVFKGGILPQGTYLYVMKYQGAKGEQQLKKGFLFLK